MFLFRLISKRIPLIRRSITSNEPTKRKILSRMNTIVHETHHDQETDAETMACLNNELILSSRMIKFPFHYRCLLEQQFGICTDRYVSKDEWNHLYDLVGESTKPVFASITMLVCVQLKHIQRGQSLFQFIEQFHPHLLISTPTTPITYMNLLADDFLSISAKKHAEEYSSNENELIRVYDTYVTTRKQVNDTINECRQEEIIDVSSQSSLQ